MRPHETREGRHGLTPYRVACDARDLLRAGCRRAIRRREGPTATSRSRRPSSAPFSNLGHYLATGAHSWGMFDHFWINSGYSEYNWGLFPVRARDTYDGPFRAPRSGTPTLVVGTTYDPATPYRGAKRAVAELGNARLLTMRGDGHTAYGGNSSCIDASVDAYFEELDVPAAGTGCKQEVPFGEAQVQARSRAAKRAAIQYRGPGVKPIAR